MNSSTIITLFDSPTKAANASKAACANARAPASATPIQTTPGVPELVKPAGEPDAPFRPIPFAASWEADTRIVAVTNAAGIALLGLAETQPYAAEQYRIIRTGVISTLQRPLVLSITSPGVADGKTTIAVHLAMALAMSGEGRTLLIDADLRGAAVHRHLGLDQAPGLADVLTGGISLPEAVVRLDKLPALAVLSGGKSRANPTDLLDSPSWQSLISEVRQHFEHVVLDGPPVNLFADHDLISAVSDGVLAVIRPRHTSRVLCGAALEKIKPKLIGVVINGAEDWLLWKKSTRTYYSHYGSKTKGSERGRADK